MPCAQLGVALYKEAAEREERARCKRCDEPYAAMAVVRDLTTVEGELGFDYALRADAPHGASHYQQICPACRRALFGLAQGALWTNTDTV